MKKRVSTEHTDQFLRRERQESERLALDLGRDVVAKLNRHLVRQILHERREQSFAAATGAAGPEPVRHRVLINLTSGRARRPPVAHRREQEERRRHVERLQGDAELALERLHAHFRARGLAAVESYWLTHSVAAFLTTEEVREVAERQDVADVVLIKDQLVSCLDGSRAQIGADQVQNMGITGSGITVAVIDTGIDTNHPALGGVVISQVDLTGTGGGTAEGLGDMVGHGTHCAGIVASQDGTFHGIAPGAQIRDIKIMHSNGAGSGVCNSAQAVAGVQAAVTAMVQVASCSWGFSHANGAWQDPPSAGQPDGTCVLCTAVNAAVNSGIVFAVAAGNEDNDSCSSADTHLDCPGLAASAITVAACDKHDSMASFSSVGPTPQGRAKPDLTAPGVDIGSCRASGTSMGRPIDANFTRADGTSMATPHIAGVAALMLAKNSSHSPASIKDLMMRTARDLGAPANQMGSGRVDALAAVNAS